jgi:hypothetical protein
MEYSSDSSLSSIEEKIEMTESGITLQEVNDCIREFEKQEKRETRKSRVDALHKQKLVEVDKEVGDLLLEKNIQLTRAQAKALRKQENDEIKERTAKQKEATRLLNEKRKAEKEKRRIALDGRRNKEVDGVLIPIKQPKPPVRKPKKEEEKEEEEEEEEKPRSYQARKPKLDDIDEKLEKLNQINQVINTTNPYLALLMKKK